jgi:hypothetical protein
MNQMTLEEQLRRLDAARAHELRKPLAADADADARQVRAELLAEELNYQTAQEALLAFPPELRRMRAFVKVACADEDASTRSKTMGESDGGALPDELGVGLWVADMSHRLRGFSNALYLIAATSKATMNVKRGDHVNHVLIVYIIV